MNDNWATPQALFDKLNQEFRFTLDVCALPENTKCPRFFTPEMDALRQDWRDNVVWMNPPYGRGIEKWMEKAYYSRHYGARVVALVPSRTNAPWWHDYCMKAHEIRFIRKKVPFEGRVKGVPFWGSAIVIFRPGALSASPKVSSFDWRTPEGDAHE